MNALIERFGFVALAVTDLNRSVAFAQDVLGLRETRRDGPRSYLSCNTRDHELILAENAYAGLERVGLEVSDGERLQQVRTRVEEHGFEVLPQRDDAVEEAFCFRFVGGAIFEVFRGMPHSPVADGFYSTVAPRPRKLGHVTLRSDKVGAYVDFFCDALGFRVSDWLEEEVVWLRNTVDHHSLAVVRGGEGMHHYAFELESFSAFEQLGDNLIQSENVLEFGPGRHGPGYNLFTYLRDPDGMLCEHFADLQQIEADDYEPRVWPATAHSLNQWGPAPPDTWLPSSTPHVDLSEAVTETTGP
jgi:catechol-2,3-dioxygenase